MTVSTDRETIAKLLRRTVEAGCTPAEAATALRVANRLMARHGLTAEDFKRLPRPAPPIFPGPWASTIGGKDD